MCFVDLEKAFDRVPRKVMEWALTKKSLPEVLVKAVMSLYESSRTKVRDGSGLLEKFEVRVGVHQGSVISPLIRNGCEESVRELQFFWDLLYVST